MLANHYPGSWKHQRRGGHVWCQNMTVSKLIDKFGGKVYRFKELSLPCRLAIAHYMAIDGEAWTGPDSLYKPFIYLNYKKKAKTNLGDDERFRRSSRYFLKNYGDHLFGLVNIPTFDLAKAVYKASAKDIKELFPTFEIWFEDQLCSEWEKDKEIWPVILNSFESTKKEDYGGLLEDGWHRFYRYVCNEKQIPCIWFPKVVMDNDFQINRDC